MTALAGIVVGGWIWASGIARHLRAARASEAAARFGDVAGRPEHHEQNLYRYFGFDAVVYLGYFVTPRGLAGGFLAGEGVVRLLHALATGEPIGFFLPWLFRKLARARRKPPPADRVARHDDGTVTVLGAPRDWGPLTTFELDGRRYVLDRAVATGELIRYELRPAPDNHLIRGVVRLDPPD